MGALLHLSGRRPRPHRTLALDDLVPATRVLPEERAEQVADQLRAATTGRVLVCHDRHHHTARVYTDPPTGTTDGSGRPAA
jgi:hypothetical protein